MSTPHSPVPAAVDVEEAEAALLGNYPRLVRLAYLTLPPADGPHRRVLAAHGIVQRALPRGRGSGQAGAGPGDGGGRDAAAGPGHPGPGHPGPGPNRAADPAYAFVRLRVLRAALGSERRSRWQRALDAALPRVWGLRLHPVTDGADQDTPDQDAPDQDRPDQDRPDQDAPDQDTPGQDALDHALAALDAPARAAYALRQAEGLPEDETRRLLTVAGVAQAAAAVDAARRAGDAVGPRPGGGLDPCTVRARPTDLLRRRQRTRLALAAATVLAVGGTLIGAIGVVGPVGSAGDGDAGESYAAGPPPYSGAFADFLDPARLLRASATGWTTTARTDFTAWPARGGRTHDRALLGRALAAWAHPGLAGGPGGGRLAVSASPGTARTPPAGRPQLLYAGDVDLSAVVVMYDGMRIVRYSEPLNGDAPQRTPALDFARVDGADLASATAVVVSRTDGNARFLAAPWVTGARVTDLLRAGDWGQPLRRWADGVSDPVRMPGQDGVCDAWPVLRFTLSPRAGGEHRPILLTDLGGLAPVHLVYRPADGTGPVEATGPMGQADWSRTGCGLAGLRGQGVRTVTAWPYARQALPDGGGFGSWLCLRADAWGGSGRALALFAPPGGRQAVPVGRSGGASDACVGTSPQIVAGVLWKSAADRWYLLAAGGPGTARIAAAGGVRATADGTELAVPAGPRTRARVTAVLGSGRTLTALR